MNVLEFIATMWGITCAAALIQSAVTKSHTRQLREIEKEHAIAQLSVMAEAGREER